MPLKNLELVNEATRLLREDRSEAAHLLLAEEYRRDTTQEQLGQIANLILPCRMFKEAEDALMRLKFQPLTADPVQEYRANVPEDEGIGMCVDWKKPVIA